MYYDKQILPVDDNGSFLLACHFHRHKIGGEVTREAHHAYFALGNIENPQDLMDITALCVVTAPDGVTRMYEDHPDVRIVAASHDRELNDHFYIVPGLGDMGDRLFGTL